MHGANRLASNSLLEGLVFSRRIAEVLPAEAPAVRRAGPATSVRPGVVDAAIRPDLQAVMTEQAGVLRSSDGLAAALDEASRPCSPTRPGEIGTRAWEATNLLTISTALAEAARLREETRGSHWREDFPDARRRPLGRPRRHQADRDGLDLSVPSVPADGRRRR